MSMFASRSESHGAGPSSRRRPVVLLACLALAGGTFAAGCGAGEEESTASPIAETTTSEQATSGGGGGGSATSTDRIDIADFKYDPETITVDAGTKISWTNSDEAAHTATADDSSFDTGTLDLDDQGSASFDKPGTYAYYCRFHPFMKATVEVK
jgi:plastocyanin